MTRTRRIGRAALVCFALGLVFLNALAYNHARAMMRFSTGGDRTRKPESLSLAHKARVLLVGVNIPRPQGDRQPADLAPDCRPLAIPGPDGASLGAWYVDRGADTPLAILFHGYGREKTSLLPEARAFLELGASVLVVDFRGSGESPGSVTTIGYHEADDVAHVLRHARGALHHRRVLLYGQSMGAAAILRAVHVGGIKPDGVMIEAVFDRMLSTVRHRFQAMGVPSFPSAELLLFWGGVQGGFDAFTHNPVEYAVSLTCPTLVLHGANDPRARSDEGRLVYDKAPAPKRFRLFADIGHEAQATRFAAGWKEDARWLLGEVGQ
jgi:pimeloyl-ACP methyl ester carboxylesterase